MSEPLTEDWLGARTEAAAASGRVHRGDPATVEVVVSGGADGAFVYHVVLADGEPLRFEAGPAPGGASAVLEQTRQDALAQAAGDVSPVVAYMRGTTKTKGETRPLYDYFLVECGRLGR